MIPIESLLAFILASVLLSLAPGPDNLFVLMQSALYGKKSGVMVTLGLCTGLIFHTTAVALGVAVLFQTSALAFTVLKLFGALYLTYLAWQAFKASANTLETSKGNILSSADLYRRGIIMNLTNPKVTLFFLAFLPQFTSVENGELTAQILLLGGVFILVALVVFNGISITAGTLGEWFQTKPKIQVYLNRIAGTVFALLAIKLLMATQSG